MNVRNTRKPDKRFDSNYNIRFKLQSYGYDNLYPQNIIDIVGASGTAKLCLSRYEKFVEGYGFSDLSISEKIINRAGETNDDILRYVAGDITKFGGVALHVNYNVFVS